MSSNIQFSAILSEENTDYDLFLLLWYIYEYKDGKPNYDKPIFRKFGSKINPKLKPGQYVLTYQLGGVVGEELFSVGKDQDHKKEFNLRASVLQLKVALKEGGSPKEWGVVHVSRPQREQTKWIMLSYPIAIISGNDFVYPAHTNFILQALYKESDPTVYSDEISIKSEPGEIRSMTMIANKTRRPYDGYEMLMP